MAEIASCPECGAELAPGAPEAPCPACLMKLGMQSWAARRERSEEDGGNGSGRTATRLHPFQAPSPAEVAPRFPQLEILELRGQGGMGAVYKARQKSLDRLVALKIINPEAAGDPDFASRFSREAKALARLNHPHIVGIHDFGEAEGLYYFVMEYVDGVDLRTLIADGKLPPAEALALVPQICDALQYAHEEGIVHRDIKPENILIDKRGRAKIADFGLAKMLRISAVELTLTHTRQVMGTFHYMAPEQFDRPGEIDHRVDIYALGVVLYEMLTGTLPVGRFDLPSQRCGVDARLDQVVLKALEREPERRYQHASDVKTDVESVGDVPHEPPQRVPAKSPASAEEANLEEVRENLAMPAIGLMVYGGLGLVAAVVAFGIASAIGLPVHNGRLTFDMMIVAWCAVGGGLLATVVLATGIKMRNLDNYDFVVAGAIITLLTFLTPFTWPFAIPLGLWSLWLLRGRDVRRAFALQRRLWQDDPEMAARRAAKRKVAGPAWGLAVVGVVNIVGPVLLMLSLGTGWAEDLWGLLFGALPGVLMVIGGLAMQRLAAYELAMIGIIAAALPCSALWLVSLPLGLWALSVLSKPQIRMQFNGMSEPEQLDAATPPNEPPARSVEPTPFKPEVADAELQQARDSVAVPAVLLIATGVLSAMVAVVGVLGLLAVVFGLFGGGLVAMWPLVASVPAAFTAPVLIVGGLRMKQLESRWLAITAAIIALLPLNPAWVVGMPAAIWSLIVLNRSSVEQAFGRRSAKWDAWERAAQRASILLTVTAILHVLFIAPFWVIYFADPPTDQQWVTATIFLSVVTAVVVLIAMVMVHGANQMRRGESRGWALSAGAAALLPVSPAVLLGLPTGLYAISLLTQPGVREWFATPVKKEWEANAI